MLQRVVVSLELQLNAIYILTALFLQQFFHFDRFHRIADFEGGLVVIVIRYVEKGIMQTLGEQVLHRVGLLLRRQVFIRLNELTHIDRLAELHTKSRTETEEIAVTHPYRYNVKRHIGHQFMRLESNSENAFGKWKRGIFRLVCSFGEDTERYSVLQYIYRLVNDFLVLLDCLKTVTLTHDWHNLQEMENLCQDRVLEDICTSHKHLRSVIVTKHHQGIHQCVSMVGCKDDGSILRDIVQPYM